MSYHFKIYNQSELEQLRLALEDIVRNWGNAWLSKPCSVQAVVNAFDAPGDIPGFESSFENMEYEPSAAEQLIWCSDDRAQSNIEKSIFAFAGSESTQKEFSSSEIGQSAVIKAKEALEADLLSNVKLPVGSSLSEAPIPPIWQSGSGWILLSIQFEGSNGYLLIHPQLVVSYLANSDVEPLVFRSTLADAIQAEQLSFKAKLCDISLKFSDIESLRPGDVIMSEAQVGESAELLSSEGVTLASGRLVDHKGHKALQISAGGE